MARNFFSKGITVALLTLTFSNIFSFQALATTVNEHQNESLSEHQHATFANCPGMYTCYGCNSALCNVKSVQKISTYYTKSEAAAIAKKCSSTTNLTTVLGIFSSFGKPAPGILLSLYGYSVGSLAAPFNTAVAKGTGVTISYEMVVAKTTTSSSVARKLSYRYS